MGLISSIIAIISGALVLIASSKNKPMLLIPWLVLTVLGILSIIGFIGFTIFTMATTNGNSVVLSVILGICVSVIGKSYIT